MKTDSSSDLTIFIISFISSLEIINVVLPDPNIFLWIAVYVADAAAVNPNGIKMLLANGLSTLSFKEASQFLVMVKVYLKIFLIVSIEFLIILY